MQFKGTREHMIRAYGIWLKNMATLLTPHSNCVINHLRLIWDIFNTYKTHNTDVFETEMVPGHGYGPHPNKQTINEYAR